MLAADLSPIPESSLRIGRSSVDVVVPVFNAAEVVRRCLESVLKHPQATPFELVVVDDASTEPDTVRFLDELAASGRIVLLRNATNQGFVGSVNRGMALHGERDVVLLNSDTEVANDWLDRLRRGACSQPDVAQGDFRGVGTATPFSNNATICSFPLFCADNPLPEGVGLEELDALFARANAGRSLDIPTAVGFCMYIRRACLDAVGGFDAQRFGRGYGEENDFCRRALKAGWRNVLCADTFVYHAGAMTFRDERGGLIERADAVLRTLHPDYFDDVHAFIRTDPAAPLRRAVEIDLARLRLVARNRAGAPVPAALAAPTGGAAIAVRSPSARTRLAGAAGKPVQMHVVHDLGGGVERWCKDFCAADTARTNLVLKPFCRGHAAGEGLMLFADINDPLPIGLWIFASPIEVTAATHPEYPQVIAEIVRDFNVDAVLVSSLIGHSLDVLATGLPTVFIGHDYFPSCPAINLYYDGICRSCDSERLVDCLKNNPDFNPFLLFSADERLQVRQRFLELLVNGAVSTVVPSRTVWDHLQRIFPVLDTASWVAIPHGVDTRLVPLAPGSAATGEKLRIVVLGMLSVNKGLRLLTAALDRLTEFAEIHLVGALEVGELFLDKPDVHVVTRYALDELQSVIARIRPHAGMLLSIWPETYSYTLSELMLMGVPPVATRVGSFAERIIDGETGFLVEPRADALVARLKEIDADRAALDRVRANLAALPRRSVAEMVGDYHRLLPVTVSAKKVTARPDEPLPGPGDALAISQAVALTGLWKNAKSLHLQLSMTREARPRVMSPWQVAESQRATAESQRQIAESQRAIAESQRAIAEGYRAVAESQRQVAEHMRHQAEKQLILDRLELQGRINVSASVIADQGKQLAEKHSQIQALTTHVNMKEAQLAEVLASTSWRVSSPIRALGHVVRRTKKLGGYLRLLLREPATTPKKIQELFAVWQRGGLHEVKWVLRNMQSDADHQDAWGKYHQTFRQEVKPRIVQRIREMAAKPSIAVIVPTYNTPKIMLREMLQSVLRQLYPNWELCVADDGSSEPHVKDILEEFAAKDRRVKVFLCPENKGVSHASNRALEMATADFVVLLDHDDILEEQALFRVAESILDETPDMVYSDEVMVSKDTTKVEQYAFRPAFSPEFLRGHPYFVHLIGFRRQLLLAVGGFDESLSISQDYDLILRASEKARKIVHIPEILYQWRLHGSSSGQQKMQDVMATSRAILQRHLERCGDTGTVNDGVRFNLFDVRYPLDGTAKVAIIIPTKNHGDLVRQCVDSIHKTVSGVAYDIVVIDHESNDPDTLSYLASISPGVRILRYSGPFNFSAINNFAVAQLDGSYSHYLFCNNDIEAIKPGWLERMMELGQQPAVGIVGAQLLYPDGVTIQHAGVCVGTFGAAEHYAKFVRVPDIPLYLGFSEILTSNHEVSAVTAACLLIRKEAFAAISGFDEVLAVGFGDVDLCLRVCDLGYKVVYCPHAELLHHESFTRGKTTGADPHPADSAFFQARWQHLLQTGDPYFNPGLSQNSTAWQMRHPMKCGFEIRRRIFERDAIPGRQKFAFSHGGAGAAA